MDNFVEQLGGRVGWENCVKGVVEKCCWKLSGKRCWPDYVEKLSGKIQQKKFIEKLYRTIELTSCWTNWMTILMNRVNGKISLNNQVHTLGVKFGEIIGFTNFVEKWVNDWWQNWVYNLVEYLFG